MGLIGHNGGPSVQDGESWRRHCWTAARAALLPTLPIEVLRTRVRRAADLGLDYKTYASVRAATGHDVVAFLFSSNALRVTPVRLQMAEGRAAKLSVVRADRIGLAQAGVAPWAMADANPVLDRVEVPPALLDAFGVAGRRLREILGKVPSDRVILVGDMGLERDWCAAGRLAAYLPGDRFFAAQSSF